MTLHYLPLGTAANRGALPGERRLWNISQDNMGCLKGQQGNECAAHTSWHSQQECLGERRLWNISQDNMGCLKGDRARPRAPDLAQLLAPVIQEMDPEEEVEEQYKVGRLFRQCLSCAACRQHSQ